MEQLSQHWTTFNLKFLCILLNSVLIIPFFMISLSSAFCIRLDGLDSCTDGVGIVVLLTGWVSVILFFFLYCLYHIEHFFHYLQLMEINATIC